MAKDSNCSSRRQNKQKDKIGNKITKEQEKRAQSEQGNKNKKSKLSSWPLNFCNRQVLVTQLLTVWF